MLEQSEGGEVGAEVVVEVRAGAGHQLEAASPTSEEGTVILKKREAGVAA